MIKRVIAAVLLLVAVWSAWDHYMWWLDVKDRDPYGGWRS